MKMGRVVLMVRYTDIDTRIITLALIYPLWTVLYYNITYVCIHLYFVSSQKRLWRHWSRQRIHAARRTLYTSILVFLFERFRKHTSCSRGNKYLRPEDALTSRSFSRWDKVYTVLFFIIRWQNLGCYFDVWMVILALRWWILVGWQPSSRYDAIFRRQQITIYRMLFPSDSNCKLTVLSSVDINNQYITLSSEIANTCSHCYCQ